MSGPLGSLEDAILVNTADLDAVNIDAADSRCASTRA